MNSSSTTAKALLLWVAGVETAGSLLYLVFQTLEQGGVEEQHSAKGHCGSTEKVVMGNNGAACDPEPPSQ